MKVLLATLLLFISTAILSAKPNVVFILTDNHGAWTLGCYGNKEIHTPNIDKLAAEGMLFTRAYCNNSVCSPSRATFLTGLMPSQHGVHCLHSRMPRKSGRRPIRMIKEFRTLAENSFANPVTPAASPANGIWATIFIRRNGFTYWFTKEGGHTTTFYNDDMIWQGKIYKEPKYTTDAITDHAIDFIEQNHDETFLPLSRLQRAVRAWQRRRRKNTRIVTPPITPTRK